MTDDLLTRTACGLYVMGDGKPRGWPNFTWTQQVADMPGDQEELDALALIGKDLMGQLGTHRGTGEYVEAKDVAFACLHTGEVPRAEHVDLDYADPAVPDEAVAADRRYEQLNWTVCGLLEETWRPVSIVVAAGTPSVAYLRAWEWYRDKQGAYMLLAAVHEDTHPRIPVFGFADPWARDQAAMDAKASDWGLTR